MTDEQFKALVLKYEKLVYTICYQFTKDYHKSQDLAQETFISVYSNIHRCNEQDYKPWIARIATNKAKDYLKSSYYKNMIKYEEYAPDDGAQTADFTSLSNRQSGGDIDETFNLVLSRDTLSLIKEKIFNLKEPYLLASKMYFIEEMSVEEIADKLNRPKKTVHTQLARAKLILQKELKEEM